ncbi:MAG: GPW/gp25 family protein [Phaeodactylibacter sp.]|nr:GPW/gp25 family protein [Phaeodactylibacter sp.]
MDLPFLGKGWSFPPRFNQAKKTIEMLEGKEDIKSSLDILLTTRPGERIMQPDFGCNLEELVFENLDLTLKTYMQDLIETAVLKHEARIDVEAVRIRPIPEEEGWVLIAIDFRIRNSNSRYNYVFPFFKEER